MDVELKGNEPLLRARSGEHRVIFRAMGRAELRGVGAKAETRYLVARLSTSFAGKESVAAEGAFLAGPFARYLRPRSRSKKGSPNSRNGAKRGSETPFDGV